MLPPSLVQDLMGVVEAEASRARVAARGAAIRIIAGMVAALLFIGALGFLTVGGYRTLTVTYDDFTAGAIMAAALASVAVVIMAFALLIANRKARLRAEAQAALARAALSGDMVRVMSSVQALGLPPVFIGVGALVAGVVAGFASKSGSAKNE
ncbi:hypothetical protein [Minwuia sp.]|uniref:hypothetical protein n=1 Tax=Minwuia sp. TaxID=2493630 RepID=UPI003A92EF68